jgi:multidrug efflux system outer membrane protein
MRRAVAIALLALGGCSLEPHYVTPLPAVAPGWPAGDAYLRQTEASLPAVTYRDIFREPRLQSLIDRALSNNQNVAISLANVEAARAQYRVQRSQIFPTMGADSGVSVSKINTAQQGQAFNGGGTRTVYNASLGLSSFEIDLFGRLRNLSKAALQEYLGTEAAVRATRLSLVGELASAYLTLASDRSLLAIAVDTETSAQRSVDLTRARLRGGVAPRSDLRQAETVLAQARSDRADLITAVAQDRNAIDLLVGAPVADADLPASIESVDGLLAELPAGLDSRVLLRRPDVVQAEYQLRAENARIGAARAAFFPSISLTGAIGFASTALSSLFTKDTLTWSVSPGASLTLFDGGARSGNLALARAQREAALGRYQLTIQTAFREVADALARRGTIDRQIAAQRDLEAAARDNFVLAEARYREGIEPFLTTLDAQRTFYNARRSLTATRLIRADNLVSLYRVLGGDMLTDALPARSNQAATPRP